MDTMNETPDGVLYTATERQGIVTVMLANKRAAKRVKREAGGWYSQAGEVFQNLDAVADSMKWAWKW